MTQTTIKVSPQTRDRVKNASGQDHRTADQVINLALDALERLRRRETMREESLAGLNDPTDQAAISELRADMDDLRAW